MVWWKCLNERIKYEYMNVALTRFRGCGLSLLLLVDVLHSALCSLCPLLPSISSSDRLGSANQSFNSFIHPLQTHKSTDDGGLGRRSNQASLWGEESTGCAAASIKLGWRWRRPAINNNNNSNSPFPLLPHQLSVSIIIPAASSSIETSSVKPSGLTLTHKSHTQPAVTAQRTNERITTKKAWGLFHVRRALCNVCRWWRSKLMIRGVENINAIEGRRWANSSVKRD